MERNVMGELNVYRGSGAKPNFSEIARRHGMDRHTVAKYWRDGESAADGRSARGSAFDPLEEEYTSRAPVAPPLSACRTTRKPSSLTLKASTRNASATQPSVESPPLPRLRY